MFHILLISLIQTKFIILNKQIRERDSKFNGLAKNNDDNLLT